MGASVAIFGSGISGCSAEKLARSLGYRVTCFDEAPGGAHREFGPADLEVHERFIFSPGFAAEHPWRKLVAASGRRIQSELSFAAEHWKGRIIGVTGTNGKTTLTTLLAEALQASDVRAGVAGNIGRPLSELVLDATHSEASVAVCEISSFQAELVDGLRLDALLWTNFAEDHLDRYATMEAYFSAKANLLNCLKPDAVCVLSETLVPWFQRFGRSTAGLTIAAAAAVEAPALDPESVFSTYPQSENFLLASAYWQQAKRPAASLEKAAVAFRLAPHRLDAVLEKGGVTYWNDSKSTNFHSALAATRAVARPIVWIGGGRMKGGDLKGFAHQIAGQIDAAVLYGEAATALKVALDGKVKNLLSTEAFKDAVQLASAQATALAPSHVLMSPGFSSLDQFLSYEERGKSFISIVLSL